MHSKGKFTLGNIVATSEVLDLYGAQQIDFGLLFDRHRAGDWGDVTQAVHRHNKQAIHTKHTLTSVYTLSGYCVQIVTGNDHRCTTISLLDKEALQA
jgi:hypothetical protein